MGNVFMRKTEDVFKTAKEICSKVKLKKDVDFLVVDFHGEITSEKMAAGHFSMVKLHVLLEHIHMFLPILVSRRWNSLSNRYWNVRRL